MAEHGYDDEADSADDARGCGPDEGIGRPGNEHERGGRASVERPVGEHRRKAALGPEGKPAEQVAQRHAQAAHREDAEDGPAGVAEPIVMAEHRYRRMPETPDDTACRYHDTHAVPL